MLRIILSGMLIAATTAASASIGSPPSGPCVYDARNFCASPVGPLGANKKPVPCLMSNMEKLAPECQSELHKAMEPAKPARTKKS